MILSPFSALTLLLGQQEGHPACVCSSLVVTFDYSFARPIAPVVTTTSIILSSNKIHNGDMPALANRGPPGKTAVKFDTENAIKKKKQGYHVEVTGADCWRW